MGIDYSAAKKLIQLSSRTKPASVLMLGRHTIQIKEKHINALDKIFSKYGFDLKYSDILQPDGYAEQFFLKLGYKSVNSMDLSDFEGADILHDLNDPVPEKLKNKFELIYDGGTTEHIFDVPAVMKNIGDMLNTGGVLSSCAPGNGFFAHGFYQFGPELVYSYWKHGCGFEVLTCSMLPVMPRNKELPLPDPAIKGRRLRVKGKVPPGRMYLYYEVQKTERSHPYTRALQTDYVAKWSEFAIANRHENSEMISLREQHLRNSN